MTKDEVTEILAILLWRESLERDAGNLNWRDLPEHDRRSFRAMAERSK